jgi:hypothetical protein
MATANKAITGMGSVIGKVSKYSDWLGNTFDAKIEELIPGIMIPATTYGEALNRSFEGGAAAQPDAHTPGSGPGRSRSPDGGATPGGWSDWSWHQEEGSSISR